MNTEVNVGSSKVEDIHTLNSTEYELSNINENTNTDSLHDIIENSLNLLESHDDKSDRNGGDLGIKIDDKGGTLEKSNDKELNPNLDPKKIDMTKKNLDNLEVDHGNNKQGIDLENKNDLNKKELTISNNENISTNNNETNILSVESKAINSNSEKGIDLEIKSDLSEEISTDSKNENNNSDIKSSNDSNLSLNEGKDDNQNKSPECTINDSCDKDEAKLTESPSSDQMDTEVSSDKTLSNNDKHLITNSEIMDSSNTNVTDKDETKITKTPSSDQMDTEESSDKTLSNNDKPLSTNSEIMDSDNTNVTDKDETKLTESPSSDQMDTEVSSDKTLSNNNEQLSTDSEIMGSSNTNVTDTQKETVTVEKDISEEQKNSEPTEETSQNNETNIPMIVEKENPKKNLDESCNNEESNNSNEDSQSSANQESKRSSSKGNTENEMIDMLTDLGNEDQQEYEQEQQQQQQPLPEGWKRETVLRSRKNKMDIYYISPTGIRLRCEAEVYQYCEREGLEIDLSLFDFGYDEVEHTDSDSSLTLSSDDSSDDEVVWASTGMDGQNKKIKEEPSAKANALNPYDIVNSQITKRINIGHGIVLRPKVIPYKATVNARRPLPDFLENYTVLRYDDYLAFRTKEMFWQEPFMKCIYQAISERKIGMMNAAELVGVKYNKLSHEYHEFTNSPWLTEAFTEYLGNKATKENGEASTSKNSQISPIRAASPSQKILSTSRPGSYTPSAERVTGTYFPPNMLPSKDMNNMLKKCSCKKSHCLMASCPCFNNFGQCINCNCKECHNTDSDPKREEAIKKRLTKMYPSLAKDLKVSNAAAMAAAITVEEMMRKGKQLQEAKKLNNGATTSKSLNNTTNMGHIGCTCKGSCLKIGCSCYLKGLNCSDSCQCFNCANRIMIQNIFNPVKHENDSALNASASVSLGGMESISETIRRLFPQLQVQSQPASVPSTNPITMSNVAAPNMTIHNMAALNMAAPNMAVPNMAAPNMPVPNMPAPNMVVIPSTVQSSSPDVVAITTLPSSVPSQAPSTQQRSNTPSKKSSNAIKGLEDKETFLHKWVEANYKIEGSTVWEENLIFLHLRNTVERLRLGHVVTIRQLREALRKVFGPAVGPNKNLGSSHWVYNGIKPVLAYSGNNNNNSSAATSSTSQPSGVTQGKGNNATQTAASVSTVTVGTTTEVPHSIGPSANKQNTGSQDSSSFDESHKILCINAWLKENFEKSPETSDKVNIDSLYQKCLSNLTSTNKVFSISELISCAKSVFGPELGPVPCSVAKGVLEWNFMGIRSKDVAVIPAEKSPACPQISSISGAVVEESASGANNDTPMVRIHSIESLANPTANALNNEVISNEYSQKLAAINTINWLKENYVRAPGTMDVDNFYQQYLSNLKAPNKEIDVSEFIHCVKIVFGEDIGPNPCYDDKGNIRWHYVGIWSKKDAENDADTSTENGHIGSPSGSVGNSDDDVRILDGDNGSEDFCPVIENVYSEPKNNKDHIAQPAAQHKGNAAPIRPPSLSGPHGGIRPPSLSGPHGMPRGPLVHTAMPSGGTAGNIIPPGATMLKNSAGSSVARAVEVGIRVQRGPDWIHGDEDGHGLGTVTELSKNGTVRVVWDCNKHKSLEGEWYNMGLNGKYRLRPADEEPSPTVPEHMSSSTLVRPPNPFMASPSASAMPLGNIQAPPLGHPSAPMLFNPNGAMSGIPPGLMLGNLQGIQGSPMIRPMHLNPSGAPMLLNPFVAAALGNNSSPAPVNLSSPELLTTTPKGAEQAAASVSAMMPVWTHQRIQVGKIVEPGPNWHLLNDETLEKGSVMEVKVIANKQYAKVQWYKGPTINSIGPSEWGWYCFTTGEIQLCETPSSLTPHRRNITHPSGLSRRERRMFKNLTTGPRVCDIESEEIILEWLLTNYTECPGAQLPQVEIYQSCRRYMDKKGMKIRGPIVFGNIMRKLFGTKIGPRISEIDGKSQWRYQGIVSIREASLSEETVQDPMCIEEIEKMVTDSSQTCSSSFEGHNFSPPRSEASISNHRDSSNDFRNSRSPSPMSRSPSPLSSLSPASSMEQLSDIDSHDGTNLDLEENIFDDSGCLSDTELCDTEALTHTKQKELPATHLKLPDCPYDPVKDRKMWLLYMDTFSK